MSVLTLLVGWCASGGLVGWMIGARSGRSRVGLFLGVFMGVFGWVLILGASGISRVSPGDPPAARAVRVDAA